MVAALSNIQSQGVTIYVGGRRDNLSGEFITMTDLLKKQTSSLPPSVTNIFTGLSETDFRVDLSSTELRQQQQLQTQEK